MARSQKKDSNQEPFVHWAIEPNKAFTTDLNAITKKEDCLLVRAKVKEA